MRALLFEIQDVVDLVSSRKLCFLFLLLWIFAGLTFADRFWKVSRIFIVLQVIRLILLLILQSHHPTELSNRSCSCWTTWPETFSPRAIVRPRDYNPGQNSWATNAIARQIEASSLPLPLGAVLTLCIQVLIQHNQHCLGERGTAEIAPYRNPIETSPSFFKR